jgi:isopentenyl-diphosphate delta-isomerase type 2
MSPENNPLSETETRKESHIVICTEPERFSVEGPGAGFEALHFIPEALPEMSEGDIDTTLTFLDHPVSLPIFISCMTGGSEKGIVANEELARAAQRAGIAVGMGSIRVLFEKPEVFSHFHLKPLAPDVPVMANLGAVQLRDLDHPSVFEMLKRLEVQGLVVHLNAAQELFQGEGDRDFTRLHETIARFCRACPVPVIVKETGFGIRPKIIKRLFEAGAAYVDVAGAGGTNWVAVESYRLSAGLSKVARQFDGWGIPTALLLAAVPEGPKGLLASGGLRTGLDVAKALALGAELAGLALPFIRAASSGGSDAVIEAVKGLEKGLRSVMLLTGSPNLRSLKEAGLWMEPSFSQAVAAFRTAESNSFR